MTSSTTSRIEQVRTALRDGRADDAIRGEPIRSEGDWIVWEQAGSRKSMERAVAACRTAGIPAFFNAGERRFGVRAS